MIAEDLTHRFTFQLVTKEKKASEAMDNKRLAQMDRGWLVIIAQTNGDGIAATCKTKASAAVVHATFRSGYLIRLGFDPRIDLPNSII